MRKGYQLLAAVAALALVAAACGGGEKTTGGGGTTVSVDLKEWTVTAASSSAPAGKVTFAVTNTGSMQHEFVVLKTDLAADKLPVEGAKVNENAAGVTNVGEIEEFAGGQTETKTLDLTPGKYVFVCNVATHYTQGMYAAFEVK